MNISNKLRWRIILGIGLALVAFGLFQVVFKVEVNQTFSRNFSSILMLIAIVLLFGKAKKKIPSKDEDHRDGEDREQDRDGEH